jgi:hypothetical protein
MSDRVAGRLVCAECGLEAPHDASGSKAEIGDDLRDDDPPVVVVSCPERWEREFGGSQSDRPLLSERSLSGSS